jgi:hypothetical protein
MPTWTVIATTSERFAGFAPCVPSVNEAGLVAFQAALVEGGSGVFTGDGTAVEPVVAPPLVVEATSHPDLNDRGEQSVYATLPDRHQGVLVCRDGDVRTAVSTSDGLFTTIGPLGPTMNADGAVAFRADHVELGPGVFVACAGAVTTVATSADGWAEFHGLPVIDRRGRVVFRADPVEGGEGIYAWRDGSTLTLVETGDEFTTFGFFPSADDGGTVAFAATLSDGSAGIFTVDERGEVTAIDTGPAFRSFRGALIRGRSVIWIATPHEGYTGLFSGPDPVTDRLLALGDPLLDSTLTDFAANPVSVNAAGHLAVRVSLDDGRELMLRSDPPG